MNLNAVRNSVAALGCCFALLSDSQAEQTELSGARLVNSTDQQPIHLQDPFIFAHGKKYFLLGIASPTEGFQCYESSDLAHWKLDGWAWRMSGLRVARGDLHAPQVFFYQGMFCMIYSARMPAGAKLALAASTKPEGPYHDIHAPWLAFANPIADGEVFVDDTGKAYLIYSQPETRSIYGVVLNQDLSKTLGAPIKLLEPSQRWEAARRDANRGIDSPSVFRIGSKYYLTYSANDPHSPERGIGYATADKPLGPWSKSAENPLLSTRRDLDLIGPGHGSVFRSIDRNQWFLVYQTLADPANPTAGFVNIDQLVLESIRQLTVKSSLHRSPTAPSAVK